MLSSSDAKPLMRPLGRSPLRVSAVGFGCWPIAGISTLGVTDSHSLATMKAAIEAGVNFFDTAFSYGYDGESDRLLARVLKEQRDKVVLASKVGQHFDSARRRVVDGRPETLLAHAEAVLKRLDVEQVDVMYLHAPDPNVPLEESAGAIAEMVAKGWTGYAGVSNVNAEQLREFHSVCPVIVVQPPFNMLQQEVHAELRDFCAAEQIGVACYWALSKGLLAGKFQRDHQFNPGDKRLTYPIYQGQQWQRNQDFLDKLRGLAVQLGCSVAQLVIAWTVAQPGITTALCGAKRPEQIQETASAMHFKLEAAVLDQIDGWIHEFIHSAS